MGRPVFPHELNDPDFCWLISNFQENHPNYISVDSGALPLVFVQIESAVQPLLGLPPAPAQVPNPDDFEEDKF